MQKFHWNFFLQTARDELVYCVYIYIFVFWKFSQESMQVSLKFVHRFQLQ